MAKFSFTYENVIMFFTMATLAKRDAIKYLISQFFMGIPLFDVVSMYCPSSPALLTGKIITLKNSSDPLFIFISTMFFRIRNLCGFISAFATAMFCFRVPPSLLKISPAERACSRRGGMLRLITLHGTINIRCLGNFHDKIHTANRAGFCSAFITEHSFWLAAYKRLAARLANSRVVFFMFGLVKAYIANITSPRHMLSTYHTCRPTGWTSLGMVSFWLKFIVASGASFHTLIIHFL